MLGKRKQERKDKWFNAECEGQRKKKLEARKQTLQSGSSERYRQMQPTKKEKKQMLYKRKEEHFRNEDAKNFDTEIKLLSQYSYPTAFAFKDNNGERVNKDTGTEQNKESSRLLAKEDVLPSIVEEPRNVIKSLREETE